MWPDWAIYWTLVNFSKPVATISLPKSPTFVDNFCKGAKIYHFWATFIDIWRLFTGHTDDHDDDCGKSELKDGQRLFCEKIIIYDESKKTAIREVALSQITRINTIKLFLLELNCRIIMARFWFIVQYAQWVFKWTYLCLLLRVRTLSSWWCKPIECLK